MITCKVTNSVKFIQVASFQLKTVWWVKKHSLGAVTPIIERVVGRAHEIQEETHRVALQPFEMVFTADEIGILKEAAL